MGQGLQILCCGLSLGALRPIFSAAVKRTGVGPTGNFVRFGKIIFWGGIQSNLRYCFFDGMELPLLQVHYLHLQ
jgi:hypothetical protein